MKKKVTIFWPPGPTIIKNNHDSTAASAPLFLAKVLEANGFEATIVDSTLIALKDEIEKDTNKWIKKLVYIIEETNPDILGVGSWTCNMPCVAEITRLFKARNPDIPIVLGGLNSTFLPEETLGFMPYIDYLVRGEGEYTFLELVQKLSNEKSINDVLGISFLKDGKVMNTPNRPLIKNLDDLPLIDLENIYKKPKWAGISIFFSRGCSHNCSFCSINTMWGCPRNFSPEYIVKQIKHVLDLDSKISRFDSDNFLEDVLWSKKVANAIHENFDLKWHALLRVDKVSEKIMDYLYKRGLRSIFIGVESVNVNALKFMNKTPYPKLYIKHFYKILDVLKKFDMTTYLSFIYGSPTETKEDFMNLTNLIKDLRSKHDDIIFGGPLTLYPGTDIWRKFMAKEIDIRMKPKDSGVTLSEPILAEKYKHLVWMVPDFYRIKSKVMSDEELEENLDMVHQAIHG